MTILESILRNDLYSFTEKCFYTVNPGIKFLPNWHIEKITEALEKVSKGEIKRLIINMPPRYLKSLCVNVAWPAWVLGNNPAARVISASYNMNLSLKHSTDSRLIMQSKWYGKTFPKTRIVKGQNRKAKFVTSKRGFRLAVSVNSAVTGEGGNFLIIDDPISPKFAMSQKKRDEVVEWFDQTSSTRIDNKKSGAIVLVMQRLNEDDLSGVLAKRRGWEVLSLPAISDDGLPLHEERESLAELEKLRADLGEFAFACQYLQKPFKLENGMIKKQWLKYTRELPEKFDFVFQSWDTAIKTSKTADYSVGITIGQYQNNFYLLDVKRGKFEYSELKREIISVAEKFAPHGIVIEDKAAGQQILQDLRKETKLPMIAVMPKYDKVTRVAAITPMIEAGKVILPLDANWLTPFEAELLSFPDAPNDDQVDALAQFLEWIRNKAPRNNPGIRQF